MGIRVGGWYTFNTSSATAEDYLAINGKKVKVIEERSYGSVYIVKLPDTSRQYYAFSYQLISNFKDVCKEIIDESI